MTGRGPFKRFSALVFVSGSLGAWVLGIGHAVSAEAAIGTGEQPPSEAAPAAADPKVELSSTEVVDGSLLVVTVTFPQPQEPGRTLASMTELSGRFGETEIPFFPAPEVGERSYQALLGVPFSHKPGDAALVLTIGKGEAAKSIEVPFKVVAGEYSSEVLRVDPRHVRPKKKDRARIKRELAEVGAIYRKVRAEKLWSGPFRLPIESPVTSPFGTKRVFNGELRGFHQGLDLKAPAGTPIRAAAGGVVALAKDLFYTGNTVLVDHGYGLFTIYAHLSELKVKKGQKVKPNQLLGLSGMTGRASGPHLHWGAVVHRAKVNPLDLTRVLR